VGPRSEMFILRLQLGEQEDGIFHSLRSGDPQFMEEFLTWVKEGSPIRSDDEVWSLFKNECEPCPSFTRVDEVSGKCFLGDCSLASDTRRDNKLRWATTSCPLTPPKFLSKLSSGQVGQASCDGCPGKERVDPHAPHCQGQCEWQWSGGVWVGPGKKCEPKNFCDPDFIILTWTGSDWVSVSDCRGSCLKADFSEEAPGSFVGETRILPCVPESEVCTCGDPTEPGQFEGQIHITSCR
jgi:hypothetical protein